MTATDRVTPAPRPLIVCVGPLPPPSHGMANVQAAMIAALAARGAEVIAVGVQSRRGTRGLITHADKSRKAITAWARIIAARARGARVYYGNVDDGLGGVWTASFAALARALGYRVHLHHHSYRYLAEPSRLMAAIARAAGPDAVHIALCEDMAARLAATYPAMRQVIAVPNCVELPEPGAPQRDGETLVLGTMSHLTFEKGVGDFVAILRHAVAAGHKVRGIIAGPAVGEAVERFLREALAEPGLPLEWRGAVAGEGKAAFFHDIDVFVFPTKYRTEAYPLVLLEALVHGVAIVAPRRGCIGAFDGAASATVVPLEADFVAETLRHLAGRSDRGEPQARARDRGQARADGERLNQASLAAREALLDRLLAPV